MGIGKILISMIAFFGMAVGIYFAMSPYEQCVRTQKAQMRAEYGNVDFNEAGALGGSPKQYIGMLCSKATNW